MAESKAWVMIPKLDKDKTGCVLDMRPLVLCKDCKHYDGNGTCMENGIALLPDHWFCADGEPKEGVHE